MNLTPALRRYVITGLDMEIARLRALRDQLATVDAVKPPHWTQRPENRAKLRRILRHAAKARYHQNGK